jgi:hypothetical protein
MRYTARAAETARLEVITRRRYLKEIYAAHVWRAIEIVTWDGCSWAAEVWLGAGTAGNRVQQTAQSGRTLGTWGSWVWVGSEPTMGDGLVVQGQHGSLRLLQLEWLWSSTSSYD